MPSVMNQLQQLGRALMLPIAVLPVAGLLLRLGQPDLLGIPVLAAAGQAIFTNLGLLFAVGVAVGMARENHGAAALASLVGFLIAGSGAEILLTVPDYVTAPLEEGARAAAAAAWKTTQLAKLTMPLGILSGVIAGTVYNRFADIRLPSYLAFFAGRRFVPIVTGGIGVVMAVIFGLAWPKLAAGIDGLSHLVMGAGASGLFLYGVLNRLLIVTGLHHILNNLAWFLLGDFHGVTGDLNRFFAGDPSAGAFMTGFFPVMMFGLPGACLAMYRSAQPERRAQVLGLLGSIALTSFLTGVTEPIEFTFMFLAPALYVVHAVLTGLSMVLMHVLHVRLGFTFSAGLFDYVINYGRAERPWLLVPVGIGYFALYYGVFRAAIAHFDLPTPGRDEVPATAVSAVTGHAADQTDALIIALGGADNLIAVDACTTRLRLVVVDSARLNSAALTALGAMGVVRPSPTAAQVVLGPIADQVAGDLRTRLGTLASSVQPGRNAPGPTLSALDPLPLLELLGGITNVQSVTAVAGRLLICVSQRPDIADARWESAGVRDLGYSAEGTLHLLVGPSAESTGRALSALLRA